MNRVSSQPSGNLVIFGGWFFGRVVAETAELLGWTVVGFVDPDPPAWITALTHVPDNAALSSQSETTHSEPWFTAKFSNAVGPWFRSCIRLLALAEALLWTLDAIWPNTPQ